MRQTRQAVCAINQFILDIYDAHKLDHLFCVKAVPFPSIQDSNDDKFLSGYAHSGILRGSLKILHAARTDLTALLEKYPGYKLVVTGHSLGAGTAILITLEVLLGQGPMLSKFLQL
jgi:predicted lipase